MRRVLVLSLRAPVKTLILARHAHAASNAGDVVNSVPPGEGLTTAGRGRSAASRPGARGRQRSTSASPRSCCARRRRSNLRSCGRGRAAARAARAERDRLRQVRGQPLAAYRAWAWAHGADVDCPGGGESRRSAAARFADGLEVLLDRPEDMVLAVSHALPIRYVLDAADGALPGQAHRARGARRAAPPAAPRRRDRGGDAPRAGRSGPRSPMPRRG